MPFDHTMLTDHERMLLEHELMQLAQANQHAFSSRNTGFYPTASAAALPPLPNSNTPGLFMGLSNNNFSSNFFPPPPPSTNNNASLDAAAAMFLARSQSGAGRHNIAAALGLSNHQYGALMQQQMTTTPSSFNNTTTITGNTTASSNTMTEQPGIETLQLECLRAEQELSERRQELERQIEARAAAQQARQQQQHQANNAAAMTPAAAQQPLPQQQQQQQQADLQKLLILQNAACAAQNEPEEGANNSRSSNNSSRASSPSCSSSSSSGSYEHQQVAQKTKESADQKQQPQHGMSSYSPHRKRSGGGGGAPKQEKKPKLAPGQKNKSKWNAYFEDLKEYKKEYGDCCVPRGFSENPKLASWVAEQRKQYKLYSTGKPNSITPERIEMLESLSFAWRQQEVAWERHKQQLAEYFEEYGHCSVPLNHPRFPGLGNWIKQQRRLYKRKQKGLSDHQSLPQERIQALADLGFDWNSTNKRHAKKCSSKQKQKSRSSPGNKRQKPMVSTKTMKRLAPAPPAVDPRRTAVAPRRSESNESLPFKKRRRISAVEV